MVENQMIYLQKEKTQWLHEYYESLILCYPAIVSHNLLTLPAPQPVLYYNDDINNFGFLDPEQVGPPDIFCAHLWKLKDKFQHK